MARVWRAVAALAACLGALVLGGCAPEDASAEPPARARTSIPHAPRPGDCWQESDYGVASAWSWWQGELPVDCGEEHNSITVAVTELDPAFPDPWLGTGQRRELSDEERAAVDAICTDGIGAHVGHRAGSRVTWLWYLPSPEQWTAGERWLRCDVAVTALGPLEPLVLEPLPPTASEVVELALTDFRLCLDTPYPAPDHDPWFDSEANVAVPCDAEAQWEFGLSVDFPDGALPAQEEMVAEILQACDELLDTRPDRTDATLYVPSAQGWARGSRRATCWLY